jgi:NAD(P)-dependent dehydrogenase (short-subunit alcohol dehydrogenase family)
VANPRSIERTVVAVRRRFGRLDCLVNNAAVVTPGSLGDLSIGDVRRMLAVNLEGPLLMTRAVLPILLRQRSGSIINVASQLGKVGMADYVTYCASKFGVVGLTQALAEELAGTGVHVWAVCPGLVDTRMARQAGVVSARERARLIRPAAVARVVVDLATGSNRVAGGTAVDVLH